jgi:hypothetical protein
MAEVTGVIRFHSMGDEVVLQRAGFMCQVVYDHAVSVHVALTHHVVVPGRYGDLPSRVTEGTSDDSLLNCTGDFLAQMLSKSVLNVASQIGHALGLFQEPYVRNSYFMTSMNSMTPVNPIEISPVLYRQGRVTACFRPKGSFSVRVDGEEVAGGPDSSIYDEILTDLKDDDSFSEDVRSSIRDVLDSMRRSLHDYYVFVEA